ncbi:hypothetical protein SAMN03159358_3084 [Paenibacillus sp. NFR01]|nr:hypothetical protein SAMN03159358_3084 [Paenibacillus sp. NFR01]
MKCIAGFMDSQRFAFLFPAHADLPQITEYQKIRCTKCNGIKEILF